MLLAQAITESYRAFWTIAVGATCAVSCALLGCYLLLRRMSLLGDAVSHGILPGIALSVLLTGRLSGPLLLLGAMLFGFLTAYLAQALHSGAGVTEDASLGVVFTSFFAIGVILLTRFLYHVDLDPQCIFFGMLDVVALRTTIWFGFEVPEVIPTQLLALVLVLGFLLLFWKEVKLAAFDPALAAAMGLRPGLIYFLLIALVAGSTVSAFEAVGSILVLAMLIVPPATAVLLTDRLAPMLLWSAGLALSSTIFAYVLASPAWFASNTAGMMAVVSGLQLVLAIFLAPRHGIIARGIRHFRLALRIAVEEILASLYRSEEGAPTALHQELRDHGIPAWISRLALLRVRSTNLVARSASGNLQLTAAGRQRAEEIIRAHRLWEAYLDKNFDLPADHLHAPASRMEHFIGPQMQGELARQLDSPERDPHGRSIPPVETTTPSQQKPENEYQ